MAKVSDELRENIQRWANDMRQHQGEYVATHTFLGVLAHGPDVDKVERIASAAVASVNEVSLWFISADDKGKPTFGCHKNELGPDPIGKGHDV